MAKKVGARIRIDSESVAKASEPEDIAVDDGNVVMEQFAREFTAVLQLTREKQAKELTSTSFGGAADDVVNARQEVACFGDITQKLVPLVDRLMQATPDQIAMPKKTELLLTFGDKFYQAQEFQAASTFFYEKVLALDEAVDSNGKAQEGVLERVLASSSSPSRPRSRLEGQAFVRSLFGAAMCCFHVQKRSDGLVRYPGRLEKMLEALTLLRLGMELAVAMEKQYVGQFSWLTLNGSVLIYSLAKPLQTMGFSKEVVVYLKWSLLAMESAVVLSSTKYIVWRLQLGSAICDCYEDLALKEATTAEHHAKSAAACAAYLQQAVQRLRKEEELDMPLPAEVQRVLTKAETTIAMLVARTKAAAAHQPLTRSLIETTFPTAQDQVRTALDAMEALSREVKQKQGGRGTFALLSSVSTPPNEALVELLDLVMEIVSPMLKPMGDEEDSSLSALDPAVFPLAFHLASIRHCFQLSKPGDQLALLIKSARTRVSSASEGLVDTDPAMISCLLELFEALHDLQQSWQAWATLPAEEQLLAKPNPRLNLPVSSGTIPSSRYLTRLSTAMKDCVFHGDGAISRTNQELMTSVALQMWRELAIPMLNELDATEPPQLSKSLVRLTCEVLLAIHFTFTAVKFEDLLLHGHVCLRLATLLSARGKTRTGSQVVRQCLERINSRRSELVDFSSHFHSVVDQEKGLQASAPLSNASFSCSIQNPSSSDSFPIDTVNARDFVGVQGTGSQLGSLNQDLCCVQVDLLLLLYRSELQSAIMIDSLPLTGTRASSCTSSASSKLSSVLSAAETKLAEECRENGYSNVLLNIQRLARPQKSLKERRALADESIQLLQQMETQEEKLRHQLAANAEQDSALAESAVPAAPVVISRSSSAITVKVVEYLPSLSLLRKKRVQYYMVFAKPAGAGTAVSLTNNRLPGTAVPLYPPQLQATISGLLPNESYVFAVAAFDSKHELIHSIGDTSEPVVALNPLPLHMCYGYLAKACYDAQLAGRARKAAHYLFNAVVSHVCAGRPSWMANPFYRQALKRDAVAQFPIPILNLCIQALLILCHDEPGDLERDGKLVASSDLDAQALTMTQTKALEDSRKISMAIEIACATDNQEAIRVLCFKGYRLLLPLLHLRGSSNGLTFAALVTFYQALHVIPREKWDVDTRKICARVGFELFRVAQEANGDISRATLPLVLAPEQAHTGSLLRIEEDDSFREILSLFKLASSAQSSEAPPVISTPTSVAATVASPRGAGAKGAAASAPAKDKSQSSTPQATPRSTGDADASGKMQSLNELLHATGTDLATVFAALEQQSSSDRRAIEYASKICGALLGSGAQEDEHMEKFLSSLKVAGEMSSQFRATLCLLGGGSLLPEAKDDEASPLSARQDQDIVETSSLGNAGPASETAAGADDDYLYRWCGELFFIQTVLLFRKLTKLCATIETVNTATGPDTEDCTYELLHGASNNQGDDDIRAKQEKDLPASTSDGKVAAVDYQDNSTPEADHEDTSEENLVHTQLDKLFGELLEKTAACCALFRLANCWQALQAAAQQLWNAVWLAWVAPSRIGVLPTRSAHLSSCVDALLDMIDSAMNGVSGQHTGMSPPATVLTASSTPIPATAKQSMALSTVVYAATNALCVDQTWLARLMVYSLRAFCVLKDWENIVEKGSRYHLLCGSSAEGSRFSEQNFPVLIYAQQQIVNQQETLLQAAEQELSAFIIAFQEQEAKKKKKKSRLVVEEVLSPEEVAFQANKQVVEQRIQELVTERNLEREKLLDLSEIYDGLTKAINKSHQALNTCHALVEKYRRLDQSFLQGQKQDELAVLRRQIIAAYNRCVVLSRQKRQKRIVCQALQEAGDFQLASGNVKAATKSWLESLDNAFNTLNVSKSWREVLTPPVDQFLEGGSNKETIAGDELWIGLQCCSALSKLIMYASSVKLHEASDYALMAAAIFTRFYACSMPHPTKSFLFGSYRVLGQFWPGRKLLTDPDRVSPFSLGIMLVLVPDFLLQYDPQYASTVMPVIAGYEYVAEFCLEDANHVANARRFRVEALVQCGRFQEAFQVLLGLLRGGLTPRSSSGAPQLDAVVFHDGKFLLDESNRSAMNWLIAFNAEQTHVDLKKHYPEALVEHILVAVLHLAVALARHESRYDREIAIARSAAKKIARALLSLVTLGVTESPVNGDTPPRTQSISWEELQRHQIRADTHLQLSYLAFFEGDWNASKTSTTNAIEEYNAIPHGSGNPLRLELDQKLKFSLVFSRGTFVVKCRSQFIACCLAQTHYRSALETAQLAIEGSKATGEEHLRQHLEFQRLLATVFLGERQKTERELLALRQDALTAHSAGSLTYIRTLQVLSSLLRSKALLSSQPAALNSVYERLNEAEEMVSTLLEHDGWMGVGSDHPSEDPHLSKRLDLYRPAVPDFVLIHTDLAQVLLECPLNDNESVSIRQEKARQSVEKGLRALEHTTRGMSATKARLLLLKGVLLSKLISSTTALDEEKSKHQFEECVGAFTDCIRSSIESGYDRQLVRLALIELVDLFGRKLIPENEDAHVQAAFHYLNLALEVQKHEAVLFDTLELQSGTVTSVDKLPPSVCASVNAQSEENEDVSVTPATIKAPDVTAIINYFLRLLRMQHILPVITGALQDTCALLHFFLVQHHSAYARVACLPDLPPVPSTDPEIRAGSVCALWGQNLAPALSAEPGQSTQNGELTLYFTLGTTKVSIAEDSPAAGNPAAIARVEKFASSPLLSKRCHLDRKAVHRLKNTLSSLRTQMEDEDSLLIQRNDFPDKLHLALCDVQHLFRGSNLAASSEGSRDNSGNDEASVKSSTDAFGNTVSMECTLETVQRMEDLFSVNKGLNIADNGLCYFLRDLLD